MNRKTAAEYKMLEQSCRDERARSWEDSDSDGFLSQWANQQMASRYLYLAEVAEAGWMVPEMAIFDLEGNVVPAVYREGPYGWYWGILNPEKPNGSFLEFFTESGAQKKATRDKNNAKKGYYVGSIAVPSEEDRKTVRPIPLVKYWEEGCKIIDNGLSS